MSSATILVVDDEQLIRWSLAERLQERRLPGARGRRPASEALERRREGVDLVLLDYRLPDADGLDGAEADQGARPRHAGHPADRVFHASRPPSRR